MLRNSVYRALNNSMINELERIWEKVVMASSKELTFPSVAWGQENLSQDCQSLGLDLNSGHPE